MVLILVKSLTSNSFCTTRGLNKPNSAFGGNSYSPALRREINGRLSEGVRNFIVARFARKSRNFRDRRKREVGEDPAHILKQNILLK